LWLCCGGNCSHSKPVAIVPFVIRWGANTSSNPLPRRPLHRLRQACAMTIHPGVSGLQIKSVPAAFA
jgi:hypothetical protein